MKHNQMTALTTALTLLGSTFSVLSVHAVESKAPTLTSGDYCYEISDGNIIVTDWNGTEKNLIIPDEIDGMPVTAIGEAALKSKDIITVVIPDTVTAIGEHAFEQCTALTSAALSESLVSIGSCAFAATSLTEISIPDSVTEIEEGAFFYCPYLTEAALSNNLKTMNFALFAYTGISDIMVPASVEQIDFCVFDECPELNSVTLLNPECEIKGESIKNFIIYGYEGSTAENYAKTYKHPFLLAKAEEESVVIMGDVNNDEEIDIRDVILINQAIFGKISLTPEQNKAADVNNNSMPDAEDSLSILKYIVRIIDTLD